MARSYLVFGDIESKLLRGCIERPRRCAAKERNELAPS